MSLQHSVRVSAQHASLILATRRLPCLVLRTECRMPKRVFTWTVVDPTHLEYSSNFSATLGFPTKTATLPTTISM